MLHKDRFVRGKGLFAGLSHTPPAELPDADYPLLLNTGMGHSQYLTGTMTRRCPMLEREMPGLTVDIHPDDARALGLREGARVRLSSRRGAVAARAHLTDAVPVGTVFAPLHFAEAPINLLTTAERDPVSKTPEFKICAVRVEKV
nr:molybdopterin dinucleotide binding domain-containing protein [uncultured Desulfovibrio sp.]